ncbi:sugar O-acyltransferase, sialic acid O-acetyltransferase NeuD family [Chryseobacterium sp. YR221]|jgi:sugar O-acyltransferase (sialic acid O-acetyltransferase NeuD family)|nr:sugar O-acyltransferase, sialic acid O-acetyltransferase NeuD family [Chryseobacterium sp. YR221]
MYLYGASGHGKVVAEVAEECGYNIKAYIDENLSKHKILNYPVIHEIPPFDIDVFISIGNNKLRKKIVSQNEQFNYATLLHPKAIISKRLQIGEGTIVMPGVTINAAADIGKHCIINTNASVDHDCIIEDFVHISPNAALAGNVIVGEGTHIGTGASVIQGIKIGEWCTIGAGAVIINDVPAGSTVVGNPGKIIKSRSLKIQNSKNMKSKIWLSSPHMGGNELKYVKEAFDSNWVAPLGPNVDGFEQDLEIFLSEDVKIAALSAGTAALHLALIECNVSHGDEVICQSMTFSASANPIVYLGANPVFIDSEKDTWNMCPVALQEAIEDRMAKGKKPKAIIVVNLYGMPAKMDEILSIANKYDIPLIEDGAESLGSKYKGKACGTFGRFGILSFNGNKIITTSGGGALVCHTDEDKEKTVFLSTQARDNAPHYQHSEIGYNYRMSNISAGVGRGQMEVLDDRIEGRRKMHDFYCEICKNIEGVKVFSEPNSDFYSNHWLSVITIDETKTSKSYEDLRLAFLSENIESRPIWKPMHLQPIFEDAPYYGGKVAEDLFGKSLCLPSGSNLSEDDKKRIAKVMVEVFSNKKEYSVLS